MTNKKMDELKKRYTKEFVDHAEEKFYKTTYFVDLWNFTKQAVLEAQKEERKKVLEEIRKAVRKEVGQYEEGTKSGLNWIDDILQRLEKK